MGFVQRIWPREPAPAPLSLSLTERLKQLSEQAQHEEPTNEAAAPAGPDNSVPAPAAAQDPAVTAEMGSAAEAGLAVEAQRDEQEQSAPVEATAADPGSAAVEEEVLEQSHTETSEAEASPVAAEQEPAIEASTEPENVSLKQEVTVPESAPDTEPEPVKAESYTGTGFFRPPTCNCEPENQGNGDLANGNGHVSEKPQEIGQESVSLAPTPASLESVMPLLEQFKAAVDRVEARGESTLVSVQQALAELQTAKQEFEIEIRDRLDVAIAEYERRLTSQAFVEDTAGQFEERTKQATSKIFHEVKEQAWVMLNAVGSELRTFRDQFGKEIQNRAILLEEATQQAMEVKEQLEETLPVAKDILHSLPLAGEEAVARVQATSEAITGQLHSAREALSAEIENQKNALKALLRDCHQDEMRLKEEIEKFQTEAGAAYDLLYRRADESLERVSAGAEETGSRVRAGIENLAGEIEQRLLSGDVMVRAAAQIERAAQEVVEPALERIRDAGAQADTAAGTLTRTSEEVVGRLGTARQEIESRLNGLMGEQQALLESSIYGFHRKAAEELGNVVDRIVAQSTQQLDERLHSLFDDLLTSTSEQINRAARSTLDGLHDGLKGVFEPEGVEAEGVLSQRD
jgi:hypothetical protein